MMMMMIHNATELVPITSQTKLTMSITVTLYLTLTPNLTLTVTVGLNLAPLNRNICAHIVDTLRGFQDL